MLVSTQSTSYHRPKNMQTAFNINKHPSTPDRARNYSSWIGACPPLMASNTHRETATETEGGMEGKGIKEKNKHRHQESVKQRARAT